MNQNIYDLLIIGAGPAGLSAGIYGSRAGLRCAIIEKGMPGGTIMLTDIIENYPGFPEGITGSQLAELMSRQCTRLGTEILANTEAKKVKAESGLFHVVTDKAEYLARALIVATGSRAKRLNIPGEEKLIGRGVSYCATCDGPLFKNADIAIIGCGNSGLQEGRFLHKFVRSITFVEFLPRPTADKILIDYFQGKANVQFFLGHELTEIIGESAVEGIKIRDRTSGQESFIKVRGVFIYVGLIPNSQLVRDLVKTDTSGFIITDEELNTSVSGIFAAGDVRSKKIRQVVVACSEGAQAAINAYHLLNP
ncbi:MAG: thioredoxin-disulfide reductase [candidate division WOR-3 bacterium]